MRPIVAIWIFPLLSLNCLSVFVTSDVDAWHLSSLPRPASVDYLTQSATAVRTLQMWYSPATGLYLTSGWWNSANAITVLADYSRIANSTQYNPVFANTFAVAQKVSPAFLNNFYDDEGWWALAWIDVYDLTHNVQYLSMAKSIFADMSGGWDDTCGGGIWWSKDRNYKNAIANELFLSVAAHLANRTSGPAKKRYMDWGDKEWRWFQRSGMINSKSLINDGLKQTRPSGCVNNGKTEWSYNQGVILGGLAELTVAEHKPSVIEAAQKIALAATTVLVDREGVLHDPCEPDCGADGVQFKGIFVRNLVLLDRVSPRESYGSFVATNADSVWQQAQGPNCQLGQIWSGPFDTGSASSQSSALDTLLAAAVFARKIKPALRHVQHSQEVVLTHPRRMG